jgi:putative ABC transport system substrate-binding protein
MITRRQFVSAISVSACSIPIPSFAQPQGKVWRIGVLSQNTRPVDLDSHFYGALVRGLRELGYIDGKNLVIEWRFSDGKSEPLYGFAAEFVNLKVNLIVAGGTQSTAAAQKASAIIPIVMVSIADPRGSGFIQSLAHPGANITGLSNMVGEIGPKYLEMLVGFSPKPSVVAVFAHPENSAHGAILKTITVAAQKLKVRIVPLRSRNVQEIDGAFATMANEKARSFIVLNDSLFNDQRRKIAGFALKHRLTSISARSDYPEVGGLMSYGHNLHDQWHRAATFVDKIFKGASPADLPVEQPTKFELIVNQKTAKALGIKIPQSILVRADRVIE